MRGFFNTNRFGLKTFQVQSTFAMLSHLTAALLLIVPAVFIGNMSISNDVLEWLPESEPEVRAYRKAGRESGYEFPVTFVLPLYRPANAPREARFLADLKKRLRALPGVGRVYSSWPQGESDAVFTVVIRAREDVAGAQNRVLANLFALAEEIEEQGWTRERPLLAGTPVTNRALNGVVLERGAPFIALSYLVLMGLLILFLRREGWAGIALGFAVMGAGSLSTLGFMALLGIDLNLMTVAVPSLVMILSIVDIVHIVHRLRREPAGGPAAVFAPCFWTTFTTCVGFASLALVDLPILAGFGLAASVGVAVTLFWSFYLYGLFGSRVFGTARPSRRVNFAAIGAPGPGSLQASLASSFRTLTPVLLLGGAAFLAGLYWIKIDTNPLDYLPRDGRAYQDLIGIEKDFFSPYRLEVSFVPLPRKLKHEEKGKDHPIHRLEAAGYGTGGPETGRGQGGPKAAGILSEDYKDIQPWEDPDGEFGVTIGLPTNSSAREIQETIRRIEAKEYGAYRARVSGFLSLFSLMIDGLLRTQIRSGLVSLGLIGLVFVFLFRRPALVLAALLFNLIPVALTLALLGWTGIKLDITTVCVAAISLGLIVDDTVHLLWALSRHPREPERLRETIHSVSWTTLIVVAGFATMACAPILTIRLFGLLLAFAAAAAYVFDLAVTDLLWRRANRTRSPGVPVLRESYSGAGGES